MQTDTADSEFLTSGEAAKYLCVHPITLKRWRQRGEGPAFHLFGPGKWARYARSDLDAFVHASRYEPSGGEGHRAEEDVSE